MSRVCSLGLHTPTALPFCITESLLPDPPPPKSYTWTSGLPHEELLVTGSSVIWSQGGAIRRVFRYDVEKEPVVQALLTWFPSDDPYDGAPQSNAQDQDPEDESGYVSYGPEVNNKRKSSWEGNETSAKKRVSTWNTKNRSYGNQMGEFPNSRGKASSDCGGKAVLGAASGDIDTDEDLEEKRGRARALVVFLRSQAFVYFLSGISHVIHLPFEIQYAMPAPRGLILQRKPPPLTAPPMFATSNSFAFRTTTNHTKDSPRLFSMSDPLLEVGLVVNTSNAPPTENLIFISPSSELIRSESQDQTVGRAQIYGHPEVIFAVTSDAEREHITLWQVRYIPQEPPTNTHRRTPSASGTLSRRQSSFAPGTGATTPITGGGPGSIATPLTVTGKGRESLGPSEASTLGSLGEDFESGGRHSSRRVSSLVSRADLSGNHDGGGRFSDVSNPIGTSFALPLAPQNSMVVDQEPVDELLSELNMGALGIDMDELGVYDGEGLRNEVLMMKIESFPFHNGKGNLDASVLPKVFTLSSPSSVTAASATGKEPAGPKVVVFVANKEDGSLLQLTIQIQVHSAVSKGYMRKTSKHSGAGSMGYTPVLQNIQRRNDILDACKVEDSGMQRVLILTGEGRFFLYSPWSGSMDILLPPTLARWNTNVVGEDGSRRGSRKKTFARTLSTTPELYTKLDYPDLGGRVTVVDGDGVGHRIGISLGPKEATVRVCLETLCIVLGASAGTAVGEGIWTVWMNAMKWLGVRDNLEGKLLQANASTSGRSITPSLEEWKGFVLTLFSMAVPFVLEVKPLQKRKSGFIRSASMVAEKDWEEFICTEGDWGSGAEYLRTPAWRWMVEEEDDAATKQVGPRQPTRGRTALGTESRRTNRFIVDCIFLAREFMKDYVGEDTQDRLCGRDDIKRTQLATSLVALHLLLQEWKLDTTMEGSARRLCPVLRQVAGWLGWTTWVESYMLEDVEMVGWAYDDSKIVGIDAPVQPFPPPDIYAWLMATLRGASPDPFMSLQDIVVPPGSPLLPHPFTTIQRPRNPFSPPPPPPPAPPQRPIFAKLMPRTRIITELYRVATKGGATDVSVVEKMVELKVSLAGIQRVPEGIAIPLREAIARCQEQPPTTWGSQELVLVGRRDLRMLVDPRRARKESAGKWQSEPTHEAMRDIHYICNLNFAEAEVGSYDVMAEYDRLAISRLLFKDDRRIHEAAKLLQSTKPAMAKCLPESHRNEQETLDAYKEVAAHVAMRTLAVPPGRGMFNFSARVPLLTEKFPISGFNLNCVIKPASTTVSADKSLFTEEKVCWAFFHAGVSAGVSVSREARDIDTSWIVFNKPPELTNRHAGFLLGLGLNGHLKSIAKWHAFNYLTPKHTMSSIGLLLGLSVSYLGTMDTTVTKLLSVHVTRLLPPGSAELNLSPLTQTAGIMGIGLLYAKTQHRRMSEVMLSEIEHVEAQEGCVPADPLRNEGYRLAAGYALGFINLGAGRDLKGLHDMHVVERLLNIAVGNKNSSIVHILDKATAGATVALTLIYMKTNDEALARRVDVPDTMHLLDYVRPDIFLLRTLARNIIMWDEIEGSFQWIIRRLRPFHKEKYKMEGMRQLASEDMPFYNIAAGLCFSIALKFAGSGYEVVRDLLLHYLDQFTRICSLPAVNHDQRLTRTALRNCQDLVALSAATVMSGTGDIPVFRRLRRLHGRIEADVPYGSHLAVHMAIGVLFLGSGAFTFGTEDTAIAALLCAFYPLFPNSPLDNAAHLQAFRHFWTLAVEARCLVPRDVDTFRVTPVPITVSLTDGHEIQKIAPCLLPELRSISSITTTSPLHWTVVLDFMNNPQHRHAFENSQSIYVHRRSAHASQSTVFQATLQAIDETENQKTPLDWVGGLDAFAALGKSARALVLRGEEGGEVVDSRLELEAGLNSGRRDRLRNIQIACSREGGLWFGEEVVERLQAAVWVYSDEP